MKVIVSGLFALMVAAASLAALAAARAQSTQTPAVSSTQERVEHRIAELHAQLRITPAEQPQWDQFSQVMRDNARYMDQVFLQRAQEYPTMTAVQNMESYEHIAEIQ